ncbi:hypothetical protein BgiBS90_019342 [Biomphalaria glabrata]|nr:hypothetical protein BgiBS90_019342 [Biomphalaria glabrata]
MGLDNEFVLPEKVKSFHDKLNSEDLEDLASLEASLEDLKSSIVSNIKVTTKEMPEASIEHLEPNYTEQEKMETYIQSMNWFAQRLSYAKRHEVHFEEIRKLETERSELELKVLNLRIPVIKTPGLFNKLIKETESLEENIHSHGDRCYAISNLCQAVSDIKWKIQALDEDNKMFLAWNGVTLVLTGASIGIAFIPVFGIFISGGLVAVPYLSKLAHRLAVSHKRKKQFKKTKQ